MSISAIIRSSVQLSPKRIWRAKRGTPWTKIVRTPKRRSRYVIARSRSMTSCLRPQKEKLEIFTSGLVQDLHRAVMRGDAEYKDKPGELRQVVVWIGGRGDIAYSSYNPTPPSDIAACLEDTMKYIRCEGMQAIYTRASSCEWRLRMRISRRSTRFVMAMAASGRARCIARIHTSATSLVLGQRTEANLYEKSRPCCIAEAREP